MHLFESVVVGGLDKILQINTLLKAPEPIFD